MSEPTATVSARAPSTDDVDLELANTRRMLGAIPEMHWDWKPHEKSMSLGAIANHLVDAVEQAASPLRGDVLDVTGEGKVQSPGREELLCRFDALAAALRASAVARDAQGWDGMWQVARGETVLFTMPRGMGFRFVMGHVIHHRGQLSVYLRLLDVAVPGMYGPSADDRANGTPPAGHAAASGSGAIAGA